MKPIVLDPLEVLLLSELAASDTKTVEILESEKRRARLRRFSRKAAQHDSDGTLPQN